MESFKVELKDGSIRELPERATNAVKSHSTVTVTYSDGKTETIENVRAPIHAEERSRELQHLTRQRSVRAASGLG